MRQITTDHLADILADHEPPCISLYQPTHRHHPANQEDPIRYRNLLRDMENSLRQKYPTREVRPLMEKFQALGGNGMFWNHRTDGLAVLGSIRNFQVFELQRPVQELLVVSDSFHTKPLLRILQSADRYQVLCLGRRKAKLLEGNRYSLDLIEMPNVPATITEALGEELTEPHITVASYGGAGGVGGAGKNHGVMHHGHGQKSDEVENDTIRFFQVVDRAVHEHHSKPSGLPLMLAALGEYHEPFRRVSRNPFLMKEGITKNFDPIDAEELEELRVEAWKRIEPLYLDRLAKLIDGFEVARSRQLGSDDLTQVAQAAIEGRVGNLLVEADRVVPGRIDRATGQIQHGEISDPGTDDILDDLAESVLRTKGEVVVVPTERMPTQTGAAATFRY